MNFDNYPSFFKAIGDPTRLQVLQVLGTGAFGVKELCDMLGVKQSGMSHHLKILAKAGWVDTRREGNTIFYRRTLNDALAMQQPLFRSLDAHPLAEAVRKQQRLIRSERLNAARAFFMENSDEFELQQERIVLFKDYAPEALQLIDRLTHSREQKVLEVGPGKGEFLKALAERFDDVTGLDISPAMLAQASEYLGKTHVKLEEGNTETLAEEQRTFDMVVYNMVLHHVPMPESELAQCARLLNPQGVLVITDLCQHDQEWAQTQCGDQWLGFEPDELHLWASRCGFKPLQTRFLALKNGFQVQTQVYQSV